MRSTDEPSTPSAIYTLLEMFLLNNSPQKTKQNIVTYNWANSFLFLYFAISPIYLYVLTVQEVKMFLLGKVFYFHGYSTYVITFLLVIEVFI